MADQTHSELASWDHWQVNHASAYLLYQWECLTSELLKEGIEPVRLVNSIYTSEYGIINASQLEKDLEDNDT
jgi:hypothetical protein